MKNLYLIVGPSGCGKSFISRQFTKYFAVNDERIVDIDGERVKTTRSLPIKAVKSYTTRPKRGIRDDEHVFVVDEEFNRLGPLVAYTEFDGYRYGVTEDQLEDCDIYIIDPTGVKDLLENYHGSKGIKIIRLEASEDICRANMARRRDSKEQIEKRIQNDRKMFGDEIEAGIRYDMILPYSDRTFTLIRTFIEACEGVSIIFFDEEDV